MSTVDSVCRVLAAATGWAYSPDTPLPAGVTPITVQDMPRHPDAAVCLTTYGSGPEPDSRNGWEYPRLQVKVRAPNPLAALDLDRAAYTALQAARAALADGTELTDCYALQSEPQPLGPDQNGRHEYVRNYQLTIQSS